MFVRLAGRWFNTRLIFCIEKSKFEPDAKTILFPPGADPTSGGYLVPLSIDDVLDKVQQADEDDEDNLEALAEELEEATGAVIDEDTDSDGASSKHSRPQRPQ